MSRITSFAVLEIFCVEMFNRPKAFNPTLSLQTLRDAETLVALTARPARQREMMDKSVGPDEPGDISAHHGESSSRDPTTRNLAAKVEHLPRFGTIEQDGCVVHTRAWVHPLDAISVGVARAQIGRLKAACSQLRSDVAKQLDSFNEATRNSINHALVEIVSGLPGAKPVETTPITRRVGLLKHELLVLRSDISSLSGDIVRILRESLTTTLTQFMASRESELTDTKEKLRQEIGLRRKLHNTVLELKGNIRVFVRVRPLLRGEVDAGVCPCIAVPSDSELEVTTSTVKRQFAFDRVFDPRTDNNDMFKELHQLLISTLDGFNVAVLAYGITGSGKTFTMEGIYERMGTDLFIEKSARERSGGWKYSLSLSVYEVYNDTLIDLLNLKNLNTSVKTNPSTGMFHIPGLSRPQVDSAADLARWLTEAAKGRSVSSTNCNEQSSRSHLITTVNIDIVTPNGRKLDSKLSLVDLAGSERLEKSGAIGSVAKEGMFINKSLSALGDVINARVNKASHIPYRNSVLTSALQECIAGESKTLMVLQVSPSERSCDETCNSLIFGSRVKEVEMNKGPTSPRRK